MQINKFLLYNKSKQTRYKLKFKKEVGITIKSKETSSKLAGYPAMKSLNLHWLLFVSVYTNLQDLIPTLALVVCVAYNYAAKVGI